MQPFAIMQGIRNKKITTPQLSPTKRYG